MMRRGHTHLLQIECGNVGALLSLERTKFRLNSVQLDAAFAEVVLRFLHRNCNQTNVALKQYSARKESTMSYPCDSDLLKESLKLYTKRLVSVPFLNVAVRSPHLAPHKITDPGNAKLCKVLVVLAHSPQLGGWQIGKTL